MAGHDIMLRKRPSTAMLNIRGLKGQPCLIPLPRLRDRVSHIIIVPREDSKRRPLVDIADNSYYSTWHPPSRNTTERHARYIPHRA